MRLQLPLKEGLHSETGISVKMGFRSVLVGEHFYVLPRGFVRNYSLREHVEVLPYKRMK